MSLPAVIIATVKLRPGSDEEFTAWKAFHDEVIGKFPGFLGSDIIPPTQEGSNEWTIMLNFATHEDAVAWQKSPDRTNVISAGVPIFDGGTIGEVIDSNAAHRPDTNVTEVIFSKIKSGKEDDYRKWAARMQAAQAKSPGYKGMYFQPASEPGGIWTTIIRFDTAAHLEEWMASPSRKEMLSESSDFVEHEQLTRLATSFPGWVPVDPMTGEGPPNWKTAMLVLLGLFPIVMLELRFLNPIFASWGWNSSFATFIGNAVSVALTSFATMPLFVAWFGWWLFGKTAKTAAVTWGGAAFILVLFALEVRILWRLLPW